MDPTLLTLITALFGGIGATIIWESLLKPMKDQRSLAEVLAAEVSMNMQILAAAKVMASPTKVPPDFKLSTLVYTSVLPRVGELPSSLVGEVVFLYRYFEELNGLPATYVEFVDAWRAASDGSPHRKAIHGEIQACVDVFNSYIEKAIGRVNIVQPQLLRVAFPLWSWRRWRRQPSRLLSLENVATQAAAAFNRRSEIRRSLERKRDPSE